MESTVENNLPCLLFELYTDKRLKYASPSFQEYVGKDWETLSRLDVLSLVHLDEQHILESEFLPRSSFRVRLLRQDGEWRWHDVRARPSQDGSSVLFAALDAHEQAQADEFKSAERYDMIRRLEAQAAELEKAEFTTNQFLANMSHELRTPLTAILGLSEALEVGLYGDCSEDQNSAFRTINECGKSLLGLINDILDVTKLETKKLQLVDEKLSAKELASSVVRLHKKEAKDKRIQVEITMDGDFDFMGDRKRLKQTLSHILSNAIKFTQPESCVDVIAGRDNDWVYFRVLDRGPGISPEDIKRIFQPFEQLEKGLARHFGGAGLGLNLVKKLVHLMNGDLTVEARPDGGTDFGFKLPLVVPEEETGQPARLFQGEGLVLVVDDHPATSRLLSDALASWGFEVKNYSTVHAFRSHPHDSPVTMILMDGKLEDGNGLDCIRWLKQQPQYLETPVVFLTAIQGDDIRRAGLEAGAQAYLEKPVELSQLLKCVSALLTPELL